MNYSYKNVLKNVVYIVLFLVTLLYASGTYSQAEWADDPNLDQVPRYLRENPPVTDQAPISSAITINNFDNFNLGVDFAENNIAVSLQNPAWFFTAYNINAGHHTEDGYSWANVTPSFGVGVSGDPVVAYDSLGNLFYINMFPSGSIQGIKVIKSTDNGATWGSAVTGTTGNDKCWLACDQTSGPYANYVYVCMTNNGSGNFARSTNNGASFTTTFTPNTQSIPGMMVCVGPYNDIQGGAVYCVTNSGSSSASTYTFYRSQDGGANFSLMSAKQFPNYVGTFVNNRNSVEGMRTRPYPFIAADNSYGPHRGRFYCVYASNDPPGNGNKPDIFVRYSDDGGANWSTAVKANDDANTQNNHQWHPAIWCDKETGRLYINWMDTRDTPTHDSALIYGTYSDDGGVTFIQNQMISNKKMKINCTSCGGGGDPRYQGDYNGIVSNSKGSLSAWADFRNGTFMSTAGYMPDFAMKLDHTSDTLYNGSDSIDFWVIVPDVKLYTDTVFFSGEIFPAPTGGTVTVSFPEGNMITSYPDSVHARLVSSGSMQVGNYQGIFTAAGPNGTPVHKRTATVRIMDANFLILTVTADPSHICAGATTQLMADAFGGTQPYTYSWPSNPPGFTSNIANPTASPMVTTWYIVTVSDNSSLSTTDSVLVTIENVPPTPEPISGPTEICVDSVATFTIMEVFGATSYSWTVPDGVTITSGQNTPSITVTWGSNPGTVSVIAGNNCGNSNPSVLDVTKYDVPPAPGGISGPSLACQNAAVDFSIDDVTGALSYFWTVPEDATITGGQSTTAIQVLWGQNPGNVLVAAGNSCGWGPANIKAVGIESLPVPAGDISGKDTVCKGQSGYQYSVPVIIGATEYVWSVPEGATITGASNQKDITVDFSENAVSGSITVKGHNACGDGTESGKTVNVATCGGIAENIPYRNISIYPNPTEGLLYLAVKDPLKKLDLVLTDINGKEIYANSLQDVQSGHVMKIDLSKFSRGVYFLKVTNNNQAYTEKVVVR